LLSNLAALVLIAAPAALTPQDTAVLPLRRQAQLRDDWLVQRLDGIVPDLMRREGLDMWVLIAREYNSDPVLETMLPAKWLGARRRTVLVFHDPGAGHTVERLSVARYDLSPFFVKSWDKEQEPDQWARLAQVIASRDPAKIAVDVSDTFALADGLSASQSRAFEAALPGRYRARIVSGERLALGWLETRTPAEMELYPDLCRIAHEIIAAGFSDAVVEPGRTTTADLEWWYREAIRSRGLATWFHPSVSLQRAEAREHAGSFASKPGEQQIARGDLLHVDFGIAYLGLNTDTQQHAYVLKEGEHEVPAGLVRALAVGNRLQDILMSEYVTGRSGNAILAVTRERAIAEGIEPSIYTHPLGTHGHGAGPLIGLWDQQDGVPGRGDYELFPRTVWSIELNATVPLPEWNGQKVRIMLEEDAYFSGEAAEFIDGRQTSLIVIGAGDGQ
jgi:Xaa-Pro aminopeptidase